MILFRQSEIFVLGRPNFSTAHGTADNFLGYKSDCHFTNLKRESVLSNKYNFSRNKYPLRYLALNWQSDNMRKLREGTICLRVFGRKVALDQHLHFNIAGM